MSFIIGKMAGFKYLFWFSLVLTLLVTTTHYAQSAADVTTVSGGSLDISFELFASGVNSAVSMTHAGDDRLFVIEQDGRIRIIQANGTVLPTPFLDINVRVDSSANEEGLLGLAFHPDYSNNGYFYVNYTHTDSGVRRTRLSRFSVTADPNIADPNSENVLLTITQPDWNHNAGDIHFGPDGYLYAPMGDGGGSGDTGNNAQNMGLLLGKIVRIDVDEGTGSAPDCVGLGSGDYTIPNDNPFIDGMGNHCDEIWAVGFRNPWRSSFDRETGDFYIADVGQFTWEEVSFQPADSAGGENYGWRCYEGNHIYNSSGCDDISNYTFPITEYNHGGGNCSITGGYVYRGATYPFMVGHYLYTDYCSGNFWDLTSDGQGGWQVTQHDSVGFGYTSFGEDVNGELYLVNRNGNIYRIVENTTVTPLVVDFSSNSPVLEGETAVFMNETTGEPDITYQWDFGDGSPISNDVNPTHVYDAIDAYTVTLTATNPFETAVTTDSFVVEAVPVTAGFVHNSPVRLGETAVLSNTSSGSGTLSYDWNLGDGTLLTTTHVTHSYSMTGTFTITLTATSPYGTDTTTTDFIVFAPTHQIYLPLFLYDE